MRPLTAAVLMALATTGSSLAVATVLLDGAASAGSAVATGAAAQRLRGHHTPEAEAVLKRGDDGVHGTRELLQRSEPERRVFIECNDDEPFDPYNVYYYSPDADEPKRVLGDCYFGTGSD